ncbi:hypothetical protein M8J76_006093 [Diaphorina citri]|nr:hypothetical protein M8J75_004846 [Diaphorina citri]KAI5726641.1 hypothetical protein M8J76_006093 [Diaphorina citri]KAI5731205.1 hypothetical protein M8J77_006301 [Diaphorina citri]
MNSSQISQIKLMQNARLMLDYPRHIGMYAVDMVDETNDIITTHSHNSRDINKINKHCTASPRDFTDRPKLIHQKNNGV